MVDVLSNQTKPTKTVEYADCISERDKTFPPPHPRMSKIWQKMIWWWGSTFKAFENVEYSFIAIDPMSNLSDSIW